ncbi:MAG: hypothetical protein QOD99_410 [Chthoniobacter sp.]|nr:hypothetical protein [Chthoniobacter sp.]
MQNYEIEQSALLRLSCDSTSACLETGERWKSWVTSCSDRGHRRCERPGSLPRQERLRVLFKARNLPSGSRREPTLDRTAHRRLRSGHRTRPSSPPRIRRAHCDLCFNHLKNPKTLVFLFSISAFSPFSVSRFLALSAFPQPFSLSVFRFLSFSSLSAFRLYLVSAFLKNGTPQRRSHCQRVE